MIASKNPTRIYLLRHGQSEANISKVLAGHLDSKLTDQGRQEAQRRAGSLSGHRIDHFYASDLQRARITAEIIAQQFNKSVSLSPLLRERSFGEYEGVLFDEYLKVFKTKLEAFEALKTLEEKLSFKFHSDIESEQEVLARLTTFFRQVVLQHQGQTVLAVSHGGMIRSLLASLEWASHADLLRGAVKNTGYCVLQLGWDGQVSIEQVVDIEPMGATQ